MIYYILKTKNTRCHNNIEPGQHLSDMASVNLITIPLAQKCNKHYFLGFRREYMWVGGFNLSQL